MGPHTGSPIVRRRTPSFVPSHYQGPGCGSKTTVGTLPRTVSSKVLTTEDSYLFDTVGPPVIPSGRLTSVHMEGEEQRHKTSTGVELVLTPTVQTGVAGRETGGASKGLGGAGTGTGVVHDGRGWRVGVGHATETQSCLRTRVEVTGPPGPVRSTRSTPVSRRPCGGSTGTTVRRTSVDTSRTDRGPTPSASEDGTGNGLPREPWRASLVHTKPEAQGGWRTTPVS